MINTYRKSTEHSFSATISFAPQTNIEGTFYYYAVINAQSRSLCGFSSADSLISPTVKVTVNPPVLTLDGAAQKLNMSLYPNPSKEFVSITNLHNPTRYRIYNHLGTEIDSGSIPLAKK
ncbi:hypothetical protein [Sporocytophaga myxococcoides]|uniref:hypothetical protein n=1 Tax=Sporocytophaga myxococcoides TaxID=153721 RepID=UPI0012E036EA|nr:hypothetical protein [Sporocytophaga myxococcoides]